MSIRFVLLLTLLAGPLLAQGSDLETALAGAADARAAREILARALERGRGPEVVLEIAKEDRLARWLDWKKGPPGDPVTEAVFAEPSFIRLLAGRLQHAEARRRLTGARFCRWSSWPYLVQVALEQLEREDDPKVLAALYEAMRGVLKDDELRVVWRSVPVDPEAAEARRHALLRLGLARAGMSHRVAAWPGGPNWVEKGLSADRGHEPFRALLGPSVAIPRPQNRDPVSLLLAFAHEGKDDDGEKARVMDGERLLIEFAPGRVPARGGLRLIELSLDRPLTEGLEDLRLDFPGEGWRSFRFRALVGFERAILDRVQPFATRRLLPGKGIAIEGARVDDAWRPGLLLDEERAVIDLESLEIAGKIHSLELDHWSEDPGGSVWELRLNGRVLMQLIGQARPRAAKATLRNLPLDKGANRLEFRRLSGSTLHLEALRLRFE
ncbi:MAG: hypothetical protein H6807_02720 [Planctomycetes bacterium]|nr:hypothetical protein [Planctomycetota bacterium]